MPGSRKIELLVPEELLARFDKARVERGYTSLSEAVRDLIRRFVASDGEASADVEKSLEG